MERHTIIRPFMSLLLALGLILALAACGTVLDPDQLLQEEQEIVETDPGTGEPVGDDPAGEQPGEGEPGEGEPGEGEPGEGEPGDEFGPPLVDDEPAPEDGDLSGADLENARLEGDFSGFNFADANLRDARLDGVFDGADFTNADLTGAKLHGSSFVGAILYGADLTDAKISGTDFTGADLRYANLTRAFKPGDSVTLVDALLEFATWIDGTTVCAEGSVGSCQIP
jgi:hypothetical protein